MNLALKLSILTKFPFQKNLAEEAGLPEAVVSQIVRGRLNPSVEQKKILSKVLRVPVEQLFPEGRAS